MHSDKSVQIIEVGENEPGLWLRGVTSLPTGLWSVSESRAVRCWRQMFCRAQLACLGTIQERDIVGKPAYPTDFAL